MICDPLSGLETTIYTKKLDGEPLSPWSTLSPSWTTTCPTFSTKRKLSLCLKSCFPPFTCLRRETSFQPCFVETLTTRSRLDALSKLFNLYAKALRFCKVKGQTNVDHIKWACQIYRLTIIKIKKSNFNVHWYCKTTYNLDQFFFKITYNLRQNE